MGTIRLTPHALGHPVDVSEDVYQDLVKRTESGWSQCQMTEEWLCKLHYLREGLRSGKIDESGFLEREKQLVLNWWNKGS